jgi:uncharacterized protein (DUF2236 family)
MTPWWFAPVARFLSFMNRGYTPWQLRQQLGLEWSPRDQRLFDAVNRATGRVNDRLPRALRQAPSNLYLWDLRRRVRAGRPLV